MGSLRFSSLLMQNQYEYYQLTYCIIHTGDTGLRGSNGEPGIPGTKGDKGDQGDYALIR